MILLFQQPFHSDGNALSPFVISNILSIPKEILHSGV